MLLESIQRNRGKWGRALLRVLAYLALSAGGVVVLAPFLWMLSTSLKPIDQAYVFPPEWIPNPIQWSVYPRALTRLPFGLYLRNTMTIVVANMVGTFLSSTLAAYAFARLRFPWRDRIFLLCLATMMLPGVVTMIPTFILFNRLGWYNTFLPLTVPAWFGGGAFNIFLARQFFRNIPLELDEAARIDGASNWRIWATVILPLSQPVLATMGVFSFVSHWNDYIGPLIYLSEENLFTISLGLVHFKELMRNLNVWNEVLAASVATTLPVVVLFFFAQRYFMQGIAFTGMGGR